jgi:hypothetical protein
MFLILLKYENYCIFFKKSKEFDKIINHILFAEGIATGYFFI